MTGPRDIIRRASQQQRMADSRCSEPVPAPVPMQVRKTAAQPVQADSPASQVAQWRTPPLMQAPGMRMPEYGREDRPAEENRPSAEARRPVPQNIGGHAIYRGLMRSHDRMGTRHIGPRG